MKYQMICSLGSRCLNIDILKKYDYRDAACIFDYINTCHVERLIHILEDNFKQLLNKNNFVVAKKGTRTLNRFYDDVNDFHSATLTHYNLTNPETYEHFLVRKKRFENLKHFRCLYNYTYNVWENRVEQHHINKIIELLENKYGNKTYRICFIAIDRGKASNFNKIKSSEKYDIYHLNINKSSYTGGCFKNDCDNLNFMEIIKCYEMDDPRITKIELDRI
jgi:hypothetical protein